MNRLEEELQAVLKVPIGYGRENWPDLSAARAAVLVLFRGTTLFDSEVLLILRSLNVKKHPGQVAFPGGGREEGDLGDPVQTAVRETFEEVGIAPLLIKALGVLPSLPPASKNVLVDPVIGVIPAEQKIELVLDPHEVSKAEWVSVAKLSSSRTTEMRMVHGVETELPIFLWNEHKMWGLSALIFDLILKRYGKLLSC